MKPHLSKAAVLLAVCALTSSCSFDRDPGAVSQLLFNVQNSDLDELNNSEFTDFQDNPCVVLRYCGEQVGCNETVPKKMLYETVNGIDTGSVSFEIRLALKRKYKVQVLGYPETSSSCNSVSGRPIQLGRTPQPFRVTQAVAIRIKPRLRKGADFKLLKDPGDAFED